jgi:hypothetical protein
MSEDRTSDSASQGVTQHLQKTNNLVERLFGPLIDQAWIAESGDWTGGFYTLDRWEHFKRDSGHYFSCCTMKPGSTARENKSFDAAVVFVLDDVSPVTAVDGTTRLSKDVVDMFAPTPNYAVETSHQNYQVGYRIEPPERDFERWNRFIKAVKRHPLWSAARYQHTPVHYYRDGSGKNPKNRFKTRIVKDYDGGSYTLDELIAAFGIDMMSPAAASQPHPGQERATLEAVEEILDMLDPNKDPPFHGRNDWTRAAHAVNGAVGDEGRDAFIAWCGRYTGKVKASPGDAAEDMWDSLKDSKASASTLRILVEEQYGKDSDEYRRASVLIAFEEVNPDDEDIPKSASETPPPDSDFELTDWNPWERHGGPAFPLDTLPGVVAAYARDRALLTGSDVSAFAMSALVAMSVCLDHRIMVQPKHDRHYLISGLLWGLLVGDPSTRKTTPVNMVEAMLKRFDRDAARMRQFHVDILVSNGETQKDAEARVAAARRRVINDATTEKVCSVLAEQDCGAGLFRDELSGWIGAMDKYGGAGRGAAQDRSIWVKAHDGGAYIQDRLSGSRIVNNLSVSILGTVQMQRLVEMGSLDSDGLLQRFNPVMMSPAAPDRDDPTDSREVADFEHLLRKLDRMTPETYRITPAAAKVRKTFADEMVWASRMTEPSMAFGSWLGKKERTLNALALLLHVAEVAEGRVPAGADIEEATYLRALRIIENFLLAHGWLFYVALNEGWVEMVQNVAVALLKLAGKKITHTEVNKKCKASRRMDGGEFRKIMRAFQHAGWAVCVEPWNPMNKHWWINPKLEGQFQAEIQNHDSVSRAVKAKIDGSYTKKPRGGDQ